MPDAFENPVNIINALGTDLRNELTLVGWQEDAKDFLAIAQTKRGGTSFILILLLLITVLLISNTMMLAVIERTKELAMMRSMGMKDSEIILILVIEAGIIGLIGAVLGVTGGIIADFYMVNWGIDFTSMFKAMEVDDIGYRVSGVLKSAWNVDSIIKAFILGIILSVLSALMPAFNSVKLKITDALRFE